MTGSVGRRNPPMPVKYWSRAGLMLTDWCNAACACCYANCSPAGRTWMGAADALAVWAGLISAGSHGCKVHLTGGEVFGRFDDLLDLCRRAKREGLGPLEAIETNGFWADDERTVRSRLAALDEAGMERLTVSADPYHQQFVPLDRPRLLVGVAEDLLGASRVRVRWRPWLEAGVDLTDVPQHQLRERFMRYAADGRDRFTGRAADGLDGRMLLKPASEFDDNPCKERILRGRHVHVAPTGEVWPATCIGVVVGNALVDPAASIWRDLHAYETKRPLLAMLAGRGPADLLDLATESGFVPRSQGYAGKCQLCFDLRRHLAGAGVMADELGPPSVYARDAGRNS